LRPAQSEVRRLLADNGKAKKLLDWSPRVSLDEGLSRTIQWISEHLDLYRPGEYQV
jgi:dTDP-glucose 4,6-dehydratase